MKRRHVLAAGAASVAASAFPRPSVAQAAKVLRFVPQADLANPDPIWTTATVAAIHGYMIWDTLYGLDEKLAPQPQMAAGHEESADGLTFTITLRDGLKWTDGEPVLARDCVASIKRWAGKNPMGATLMERTNELVALDDKRLQFRMKKRFPIMTYVLGGEGCFIMPERIAKTDPNTQINEYVGSGPFRFLRDEWQPGSSAAYAKNMAYVPRQEPPSRWSGGKVAHFDRVEWKIMPDPATKAAALQRGEIDWWENPLSDLLPLLRANKNIKTQVLDPLGALGVIRFNFLHPPFNNIKLRQALLMGADQNEFVTAVFGDQAGELGGANVGFFTAGSPYASDAGLDFLKKKPDMAAIRKAVAESGYKGEEVLIMAPTDQPQIYPMCMVTADYFTKAGLKVRLESMDWGTLVARRPKKEAPGSGGWSVFVTTWAGLAVSNPGSSFILRGTGEKGWFGWPTMPEIEALRDQWFDAPDLAAQKEICRQIQVAAVKEVPVIPTGMYFTPTAHRANLVDLVRSSPAILWGCRMV